MARVAIIQFPGVNCEYETARAVQAVGLEPVIVRWNEQGRALEDAAALVLPGGFSYQDRIRAGVVAAKDRVVDAVFESALAGKPVLGICNGAQVLVEAGIVPGFEEGAVSLALARNEMPDREGYYCRWVRMVRGAASCVFTENMEEWCDEAGTLPVPIAHAEGRFATIDEKVARRLEGGEAVALRYATPEGAPAESFPDNPNGSLAAIAGVTNGAGNVLALMPHPERASWLHQVPPDIGGSWERRRLDGRWDPTTPGPGRALFAALEMALR